MSKLTATEIDRLNPRWIRTRAPAGHVVARSGKGAPCSLCGRSVKIPKGARPILDGGAALVCVDCTRIVPAGAKAAEE